MSNPIPASHPEEIPQSEGDVDLALELEFAGDLDLLCPGCGHDLSRGERFATFRVCPACGRHFSLPARERLALLLDPNSFIETNGILVSADPLLFQDAPPDAPGVSLTPTGQPEAVTGGVLSGVGTIMGAPVVAIVLDLAALGGSIGVVAGEKITLGLEQAHENRLPTVIVCSSGRGPARSQDGLLALAQLPKIAAATSNLKRAGVPMIAILTDPTIGNVFTGLANQADILLAEVGAQVGSELPVEYGGAPVAGTGCQTAELALAQGMLDGIVDRPHLRQTLGTLLGLLHHRGAVRGASPSAPRGASPGSVPSTPVWEATVLARHAERPSARDYLDRIATDLVELRGDRVAADDPGIVCALGRLSGHSVAVIAEQRGRPTAAGFRKADRVLRLAGHLELPVVILIDSPGPAPAAREGGDGIGAALGQTMNLLALLPVPIVTAVLGEAGGVAAMALGIGDRMLMLEHAVYSPVAPEMVRVPERAGASTRAVTARECQRLGLIDVVVPEPAPAAHADVGAAATNLENALLQALSDVRSLGPRRLLDERSRRMRYLGQSTPEGRAATRREVLDLQDLQRNLARSFAEWRDRWEERSRFSHRRGRQPFHLPRPDLAGRIAAFRGHAAVDDPAPAKE